MNAARHFANIKFYYCCAQNGGKCGGLWVKHPPKNCFRKHPLKKRKGKQDQSSGTAPSAAARGSSATQSDNRPKQARIAAEALVIPSPDDPDQE